LLFSAGGLPAVAGLAVSCAGAGFDLNIVWSGWGGPGSIGCLRSYVQMQIPR